MSRHEKSLQLDSDDNAFLTPLDLPYAFPRSAHVPSEHEAIQAHTLLRIEESKLLQCNEEIARVQRALERLEAKQSALRGRIAECHDIVSTRRRLPVELWETIFTMLCSEKSNWPRFRWFSDDLDRTPLNLSHVCSFWRDIVTNIPRLWSSIRLCIPVDNGNFLHLVEVYLKNSGCHPLIISIHQDSDSDDEEERYLQMEDQEVEESRELVARVGRHGIAAFNKLMSHCTRVRELDLSFENWDLLDLLCVSKTSISFPDLHSFRFQTEVGIPAQGSLGWFWDKACSAPRLTFLHTDVWRDFRCEALTTLELEKWIPTPSAASRLEAWPQLVSLSIENFRSTSALPQFTLPHLRELCFHRFYSSLDGFFGSVLLPSLRHLRVLWAQDPTGLKSVTEMVWRSKCCLTRLDIWSDNPVYDRSIIEILQFCPSLTHFELRYDSYDMGTTPDPDLISCITITSQCPAQVVVPKLESVTIRVAAALGFESDQFAGRILAMAESRSTLCLGALADNVSSLKHLTLETSCKEDQRPRPLGACRGCNLFSDNALSAKVLSLQKYGTYCTTKRIYGRPSCSSTA